MAKIDLHLHSIHSKPNGDAIKWESLHDSISKLIKNDVKIAAFSDHNIFNVEFYKEAFNLAKTANILILPAIEINVVRLDGMIANIIFVFEENLTNEQLQEISSIATKEIPKRGISITKCNEIFSNFKTIKIPHVGKSDFFKYDDLEKIEFDAIEISNDNHKNYLSVIKKENFSSSIVAFSDTHKWNEYPELNLLITDIDLNELSFNELKNKLNENKNWTKRRY